jgi:hypothetical protein
MNTQATRHRCCTQALLYALIILAVGACHTASDDNAVERAKSTLLANTARAAIHEGMQRQMAVNLLKKNAWRQITCDNSMVTATGATYHYVYDVFLYGSRSVDLCGVVLITSDSRTGGELRVTFVGKDENYRLRLYEREGCKAIELR